MNADIARERSKASFSVEELTYLLDGGRKQTDRRRFLESLLSREPVFKKDDDFFLDREGAYESSLKKGVCFLQIVKKHNITDEIELQLIQRVIAYPIPSLMNDLMFIPTLKLLGTKEQQEKWLPLAESYQILGTYAQTEMGHGTFVRGIETIATYDKASQEFILNSPTLSASKWWPGSMGHTCSHAIILAQVVIDSKEHGVHCFMLQYRDPKTRLPLPGIKVGDIGPKASRIVDASDNGYLLLDNVRIPRDHMLMALAQVSPDGKFSKSANANADKVLYSTMLYVRSTIPYDAFFLASRTITIAIRYSAVRRQSELKPGEGELQILDYKTQQDKLLPGLAMAYAFKFASSRVRMEYNKANAQWKTADYSNLQELHAMTSAMKAYTTNGARQLGDTCRLACGGHGYSMFSMLPEMYAIASATCTYEGDNTVLYLQVARYLLKSVSKARSGAQLPSSVSYLGDTGLGSNEMCSASTPQQFRSPHTQLQLYRDRSYRLINAVADRIQDSVMSGMEPTEAWNENSVDLVRCAIAHSSYLVVQYFIEGLNTSLVGASKEITSALKNLSDLYALYGIIEDSGSFIETGVLTVSQVAIVRNQVHALYKTIRPDAVALVDAFDYSDFVLNSALGRYDGQVYQRLFELAQKSRLNKHLVQPSARKYIQQLQQSKL